MAAARQTARGTTSPNMSQKLITLIQGALADAGGSQRLVTVDRKTIDKSWKMMDKVVKLCQHPRMNIKNSPPFILDILPDTFQQLKLVVTNYEDRMTQLASNEFFVRFMDNLINKLKKCIRVLCTFCKNFCLQIWNTSVMATDPVLCLKLKTI